jgi:hypothetical protein
MRFSQIATVWALVLSVPTNLSANDSSAELSIGGLRFTTSADISMESETLSISLDAVAVHYRFMNLTAKPVVLTVAFPLPDIDLSEADNIAIPSDDPVNFVKFETKVDGKPVQFKMEQRAVLGTRDVSAQLRAQKVPLLLAGDQQKVLSALPEPVLTQWADDGLVMKSGTNDQGRPIYSATWVVKTSAVRQQTFPPGRAVEVEHRYRPSVGISTDTELRRGIRRNPAMAQELDRYRQDYCVSEALLADVDRLAGTGQAKKARLQERRLAYVLRTGANWAGPIKTFRLIVDKGRPDRLVSLCAPDAKPASATTVEVTRSDFKPDKDLKILIIGQF